MTFSSIRLRLVLGTLAALIALPSLSGTLYLPVNMAPELEARVERVFVLANMPIIKRPIAINRLQDALDKAKSKDPLLTRSVRTYLERYQGTVALTHASLTGQYSGDDARFIANQRGLTTDSHLYGSVRGHWAVNDLVALNVGVIARDNHPLEENVLPDGTYLSVGWDVLQADIGYRAHWFGPFQESDMLRSTNGAAMPGITLSNSKPLTALGISYEIFGAEMSESDLILSQERDERLTGNPKLVGVHLSFEPVDGFAIGFNRLLQFGGADRDQSLSGLFDAFTNAKAADNFGPEGRDFGNQQSSVTTRYTFQGDVPVSVYMEYAGEDSSQPSDVHLGNSALMFGLHLPKLPYNLDLTYEYGEWQNGWYVNTNYGDGMRQHQSVIGHWAGNERIFTNSVGGKAQVLKVIWDDLDGAMITTRLRLLDNQDYSDADYSKARELSVEYAQSVGGFIIGAAATGGKSVFGDSYSLISGFIRW